ncbi:MAG: hypothetical protein GY820_42235 [Gammaproteobacteria bacterium]|nr:hypothetical protein [Gammaproteobacteria bacterium]
MATSPILTVVTDGGRPKNAQGMDGRTRVGDRAISLAGLAGRAERARCWLKIWSLSRHFFHFYRYPIGKPTKKQKTKPVSFSFSVSNETTQRPAISRLARSATEFCRLLMPTGPTNFNNCAA